MIGKKLFQILSGISGTLYLATASFAVDVPGPYNNSQTYVEFEGIQPGG